MSDEQKKPEETKVESTSAKASVDTGKKEEKKPLDEARGKEVSAKFKDIVEKIEKLSVLELSELVKELEDRFGVSATAPVAMAAPAVGGADAPAAEEKTSFTLHLADAGAQKIAVIKAVRVILPDLGLKEAKDLVDGAPKDIKKDMPKADADKAKSDLEAAGAKVELK